MITSIDQDGNMTVKMEGKFEGYGFITLTHEYEYMSQPNSKERSLGIFTGTAQAISENGGVVLGPKRIGTFTRNSEKMTSDQIAEAQRMAREMGEANPEVMGD